MITRTVLAGLWTHCVTSWIHLGMTLEVKTAAA